jgi:hypothetical protein
VPTARAECLDWVLIWNRAVRWTRIGHQTLADAGPAHERLAAPYANIERKELARMDRMTSGPAVWPWHDSPDAVVAAPDSHRAVF